MVQLDERSWQRPAPYMPPRSIWDPRRLSGTLQLERHRETVVILVNAVYWLLIFEGVLRKWMFPQFSKQLFFVRDPFVVCIYALVLARGTRLTRSPLLEAGLGFGLVGLVLAALHAGPDSGPPVLYLMSGWRNYFFYLPLAFVIARYFTLRDVELLVQRTLLVCIPMAALVALQTASPVNAVINVGSGSGPGESYVIHTTANGVVRAAGTFTSDLGLAAFVTGALAMASAMWISPGQVRRVGLLRLVAASASILMCLSVSGSRGALLWSGTVIVGAAAGLFFISPAMQLRATLLVVLLVAAGVIGAPILFPRTTEAFLLRWNYVGDSESQAYGSGGVFRRAVHEVFLFRVLLPVTPLAGYGLGSAGNAAWQTGVRASAISFANQDELNAAETDWGRNILELGPLFGCCFIAFRIVFVFDLARRAISSTRRSGHALPFLLFLYVGSLLLQGQITANGTLNGFGWVFIGLCLAASQVRAGNVVSTLSATSNRRIFLANAATH